MDKERKSRKMNGNAEYARKKVCMGNVSKPGGNQQLHADLVATHRDMF